ncbi:MAG: hypothetical protein JO132_16150 [Streptosporangiaceae bacterium]|nr:hypothetical protein [Streptosporangiaceae bacterium]
MSDQVVAETESGAGAVDERKVDGVVVEFDVPARMRDGVTLRADVYHPAGEGPWPALVLRTPYSKSSITENAWNGVSPVEAARADLERADGGAGIPRGCDGAGVRNVGFRPRIRLLVPYGIAAR